jgi:hypothetical protein
VKHGCRRGTRLAEVDGGLLVGLVGGHRVALRGLQSEQGRATAGREGRRRVLGDGGQGGATACDEEGATERDWRKGATGFSPFYWGFDWNYWGLRKNIGERGVENKSVGVCFFNINPLH